LNIFFNKKSRPLKPDSIRKSIATFPDNYSKTIRKTIQNSQSGLSKRVFFENIAMLMPNFKMTRSGSFKGVTFSDGRVEDPNGQIASYWKSVCNNTVKLKDFLD